MEVESLLYMLGGVVVGLLIFWTWVSLRNRQFRRISKEMRTYKKALKAPKPELLNTTKTVPKTGTRPVIRDVQVRGQRRRNS